MFPGGLPSKYNPGPTVLDLADLTKCRIFTVVWSYPKETEKTKPLCLHSTVGFQLEICGEKNSTNFSNELSRLCNFLSLLFYCLLHIGYTVYMNLMLLFVVGFIDGSLAGLLMIGPIVHA